MLWGYFTGESIANNNKNFKALQTNGVCDGCLNEKSLH
ncbi:hypothetical protein VVMO6_02569 [Vibrio vulnificus MO6-24/O]|nr:hypothetical protein VVMO6_02569 [Vibrio vulnificus MO6-24/O]